MKSKCRVRESNDEYNRVNKEYSLVGDACSNNVIENGRRKKSGRLITTIVQGNLTLN